MVQLKVNFKHRYVQCAYYLHAKFTCWAQRRLTCWVLHTRHGTNMCVCLRACVRACRMPHQYRSHYWTFKQPLHIYTTLATTFMYTCVGTN